MMEIFDSAEAAKKRRNELLDDCMYTQSRQFTELYTANSVKDADDYRRTLYRLVDDVTSWPAEIDWPPEPTYLRA